MVGHESQKSSSGMAMAAAAPNQPSEPTKTNSSICIFLLSFSLSLFSVFLLFKSGTQRKEKAKQAERRQARPKGCPQVSVSAY